MRTLPWSMMTIPNPMHRNQPRRRRFDHVHGVLLVDKPSGWTSHDVVAKIRNHFGFDKVGHGGTLDPMATGLLPILLGRGTKLSQQVMGTDKIYEGEMLLGIETDSHDADGQVTREADASGITREQIEAEMRKRIGDQMQLPPMVSAVKKDGVPLYKLARKGKTIEREPRLIHVYDFTLLAFEPPKARFVLKCTKGTYVRTLCADIGQALGCGAHLCALSRTRTGGLELKDARPLDTILKMDLAELEKATIPVHKVPGLLP